MPHYEMTWRTALVLAGILAIAAFTVPRLPVRARSRWLSVGAAGARECSIILALFAFWQVLGNLSLGDLSAAYGRGYWLWHVERVLHLPNERTVQLLVLPHPDLVKLLNGYYIYGHLNSMVILLIWMFVRHRDRYPRLRNTVAAFTGVSFLVQLIPVAPPRLLDLGLVDTAARYHESVYGSLGTGIADQLSSMPSVHVGWALIVAIAVIRVSTSRWRWLVLAHLGMTVFTVVATANHYWLDGVGAAILLALVVAAERMLGVALRRIRRTTVPVPMPGPAPAPALTQASWPTR